MEEEISSDVVNEGNQGSTGNHSWVVEIMDKLNEMEDIPEIEPLMNQRNAIYKRPVNVQEEEDSFLYTPRIISFGPYHHDAKSCLKTNEIKKNVLLHWLKKSKKKLNDYVNAIREDVAHLKAAYDQLDPKWQQDDEAFLRLMIYDGCFLLKILCEAKNRDGHVSRQLLKIYGISLNELMEYYKHDIMLIENQLPMQLLVKLVTVEDENLSIPDAKKYLNELILGFVAPSSPKIAEKLLKQDEKREYLHVLDVYRYCLLYQERVSQSTYEIFLQEILEAVYFPHDRKSAAIGLICAIPVGILFILFTVMGVGIFLPIVSIMAMMRYFCWSRPDSEIPFIIPSATELDKVGIRFKTNKTKSLKDISFGHRTLRLPWIFVDGATQSRFLNIITFEQLHKDAENEVTSYIYFMSRLLQVAGDVRCLQLHGIIRTTLHNDHVVELFKSLTKDIVHDPNIFFVQNYCDVGKRLTESFYIKMNNPWQRDLWQTYLKSPWAVISVLAALFLFALASVQTVYAVLSYHNHK